MPVGRPWTGPRRGAYSARCPVQRGIGACGKFTPPCCGPAGPGDAGHCCGRWGRRSREFKKVRAAEGGIRCPGRIEEEEKEEKLPLREGLQSFRRRAPRFIQLRLYHLRDFLRYPKNRRLFAVAAVRESSESAAGPAGGGPLSGRGGRSMPRRRGFRAHTDHFPGAGDYRDPVCGRRGTTGRCGLAILQFSTRGRSAAESRQLPGSVCRGGDRARARSCVDLPEPREPVGGRHPAPCRSTGRGGS